MCVRSFHGFGSDAPAVTAVEEARGQILSLSRWPGFDEVDDDDARNFSRAKQRISYMELIQIQEERVYERE